VRAAISAAVVTVVLVLGFLIPLLALRGLGPGGQGTSEAVPGPRTGPTGPAVTGPEPTGPAVTGPWPSGPSTDRVVHLPPHFQGVDGWYSRDLGTAPPGDATVAWAANVPFADGENEAYAIPWTTIEALAPDGVVITALTAFPSDLDTSGGPFPYDLS
jgi:hypothetical protein